MGEISFYYENIDFNLSNESSDISWISEAIECESLEVGVLTFVFCDDGYLYKMNVEFLDHDTLTDVITFDYCEEGIISGDIFISVDRVRENAEEFKVSFDEELHRVMVHGVMHLCGYHDKEDDEKHIMRGKEDFYLGRR